MSEPVATPMGYRSMGVNAWRPLDMELIELSKELGFNDLQLTFAGSHYDLYFDFRGRADDKGLFELADEFGFTTTMWVREFYHQNARWGLPQLDNEVYWDGLRRRYGALAKLFPEIDFFILTLVESDKWVVAFDAPIVAKTVRTINDTIRQAGKTLILRTFTWHRELSMHIVKALEEIPDNVMVSTKVVGNDWNYRQSHHPAIGKVDDHKQIVEMNLFGTWQREHYVANGLSDEIEERFSFWEDQGVYGIFVPPDGRTRLSRPIGNAQESNLWVIGRLAAGERDTDQILHDFAVRRFGETAADTMVEVLRPTGEVVEEALHVGPEFFAHPGGQIPAIRMMVNNEPKPMSDEEAEWMPEDLEGLEKYDLERNPFAINFSAWRWDPAFIPEYHKIRKGHPDVIEAKGKAAEEALASARASLEKLETVKDDLPPGAYAFTKFKLEENAFLVEAMTEVELAWLKASNILYYAEEGEKDALWEEIEGHLAKLEALHERTDERLEVTWQGIDYVHERGEYMDLLGFVDEFRRYWGIETGERHRERRVEQFEIPYGTVRVVWVGDSYYLDWGPVAKKWDISDRNVIWEVRRAMTPPDEPSYMSG